MFFPQINDKQNQQKKMSRRCKRKKYGVYVCVCVRAQFGRGPVFFITSIVASMISIVITSMVVITSMISIIVVIAIAVITSMISIIVTAFIEPYFSINICIQITIICSINFFDQLLLFLPLTSLLKLLLVN